MSIASRFRAADEVIEQWHSVESEVEPERCGE